MSAEKYLGILFMHYSLFSVLSCLFFCFGVLD